MIDKNEIKKDLYKSKAMAKFSHYAAGKLYYTVETLGATYIFPIHTVEASDELYQEDMGNGVFVTRSRKGLKLSSDLGTTNFGAEIKGSDLNRWIAKAIDSDDFINLTQ